MLLESIPRRRRCNSRGFVAVWMPVASLMRPVLDQTDE